MAPTLTSSSFLPTSPSHLHSCLRLKAPRLTVLAKSGSGSEEGGREQTNSINPFFFNIGKFSDVRSLVPVASRSASSPGLMFGNRRRKDPNTVFVAGAAGQAGVRIVQALLREGFTVRAGVPDLGAAQELASFASTYKIISKEESKRLIAVESTFGDAESIAKALANAAKAVVTIGPSENGPSAAVTPSDALQVIEAAQLAGVGHVAIICDRLAGPVPVYNAVIDGISSFFGNLFSGAPSLSVPEFLQRMVEVATDVSYTVIKTSLTEDFSPERGYNVVVSAEGREAATDDYKVAKSQIASVVTGVFSNTSIAENKVVEVFTNPSASARPVSELLSAIPEDGRRKAYTEALAKQRAEEARIASERAQEAAEAAKRLEEEVKGLPEQETLAAKEAQQKANDVGRVSMETLLSKGKEISWGMSWEEFSSRLASSVPKPPVVGEKVTPKVQIATVRGQTKARTLPPKKAVVKKPREKPGEPKGEQKEMRSIFGGLFRQETIYIDDD